jgi:hypothetical protein
MFLGLLNPDHIFVRDGSGILPSINKQKIIKHLISIVF